MTDRSVLIAVIAFAAGVCARDTFQDWQPPCKPAQVRYVPVPQADMRMEPAPANLWAPLPPGTPAALACAHYQAVGRGWRCA